MALALFPHVNFPDHSGGDERDAAFGELSSPTIRHADVFELRIINVELDTAEGGDLELGGAEVLAVAG